MALVWPHKFAVLPDIIMWSWNKTSFPSLCFSKWILAHVVLLKVGCFSAKKKNLREQWDNEKGAWTWEWGQGWCLDWITDIVLLSYFKCPEDAEGYVDNSVPQSPGRGIWAIQCFADPVVRRKHHDLALPHLLSSLSSHASDTLTDNISQKLQKYTLYLSTFFRDEIWHLCFKDFNLQWVHYLCL